VTLLINNDMVAQVLTMQDTIDVLEQAYADLVEQEATCRPRIDIQIPTSDGRFTNGEQWKAAPRGVTSQFG